MSEEIKRKWDEAEIAAVRAWHESTKGFNQVEKKINLSSGTLFKLVNEVPYYRGTRRSVCKWLRNMSGAEAPSKKNNGKKRIKKTSMTKKPSLHSSEAAERESQYCAKAYTAILQRHKMPISMTEGYDPRNNGIAERVNGILNLKERA